MGRSARRAATGVERDVCNPHASSSRRSNETTNVVVSRRASSLQGVPVEQTVRHGPLVMRLVDLRAAARVALRRGEATGELISRPYRYAPLRNSLRITLSDSYTKTVTLAPGR